MAWVERTRPDFRQSRSGPFNAYPRVENSEDSSERENENDSSENQTQKGVLVTRSGRVVNKPRYLQDYLLLAEEDEERLLMCLNDEP